jgi:TetR/AcrR family transcriptional repressor of nem operon
LDTRKGYKGGSISDLLDHVGVGRQTIYSAFGNKRGLFIAVINHYRDTHLRPVLEMLAREETPLQNVYDALRFFGNLALDKRARGCLIANALVEAGNDDPEIRKILEETLSMLEKALLIALERARDMGDLSTNKKPVSLSRALTNSMIGMAVTGRLGKKSDVLADIYSGTLEMLS